MAGGPAGLLNHAQRPPRYSAEEREERDDTSPPAAVTVCIQSAAMFGLEL